MDTENMAPIRYEDLEREIERSVEAAADMELSPEGQALLDADIALIEAAQEKRTQGITRADVEEAMRWFEMFNPKPEIPIEETLNGHLIVALYRHLQQYRRFVWNRAIKMTESRLRAAELRIRALEDARG